MNTLILDDYTPLVFDLPYKQQGISYGHSLALSVVFQSSLQHFADFVDRSDRGYQLIFKRWPKVKTLLEHMPVSWDQTELIDGDPEVFAAVLRRQGSRWYFAVINGTDHILERDFSSLGSYLIPGYFF